MHYEIDQLVDDRNRPLYEQVRSEVELKIENESEPDQGWGAEYFEEQNVAIIRTTPSSTPHASFTHELLHIELELNGYKRPNYLDVIHPTDKDRYSKWANDFRI